ncbi:hypothetical protein [Cryobacterium breve]|uniref:hypothetical protein n=1 Tax=Cryobacterium breve TaxID=1259258 RepID=UPI00248B93EF|nr:hypothetical protein [Cryobacterium breve]
MLSSPAIPFRHAEPVLVDASGPAAGAVPAAATTATPVARPTAETAGDLPFSAISFPTLRAVAGDNTLETARVQGHAAGYTAGMRAAAGDITAQIARLEADHAARVWQVQAQARPHGRPPHRRDPRARRAHPAGAARGRRHPARRGARPRGGRDRVRAQ